DEMPRQPAAAETACVCRDVGQPCKEPNVLQTETAHVSEVLRQPGNVEPPDRIGDEACDDDRPGLAVLEQLTPSPCASRGGRLSLGNERAFPTRERRMTIGPLVEPQPQREPQES